MLIQWPVMFKELGSWSKVLCMRQGVSMDGHLNVEADEPPRLHYPEKGMDFSCFTLFR